MLWPLGQRRAGRKGAGSGRDALLSDVFVDVHGRDTRALQNARWSDALQSECPGSATKFYVHDDRWQLTETMSSCGDWNAPALRMTSLRAVTVLISPVFWSMYTLLR